MHMFEVNRYGEILNSIGLQATNRILILWFQNNKKDKEFQEI